MIDPTLRLIDKIPAMEYNYFKNSVGDVMLKATMMENKTQVKAAAERIYGTLPERPVHLSCESKSFDPSFAAGKATFCKANLILDLGDKEIYLPFISVIPKAKNPLPAIIYLSYEREIPNRFLPAEEIIDRGYAIFSLFIDDVTKNSPDFKSGIARHIAQTRRKKLASGKIGLWAWAAMRLAEYVCDLEFIDKDKIIIAGHGILARSALLASGNSEKCRYVIANCITEAPTPFSKNCRKSGLTVRDYSYLYSPAFADEPDIDEFEALIKISSDEHLLLGFSEESNCVPSYNYLEKLRRGGEISPNFAPENMQNEIPTATQCINDGDFSYHVRCGSDYFSREDWNIYLDFIDENT